MAPSGSFVYDSALRMLSAGELRWDDAAENFSVLLVGAGYVPDLVNHQVVASVTNELSGSGYKRKLVTGRSVVRLPAEVQFVGASVRWASIGPCVPELAVAAVLFRKTGADINSSLVAYIKISPADIRRRGTLTVRWDQRDPGALFKMRRS